MTTSKRGMGNCEMITHLNLVEIGIKKCPHCDLILLSKEEYKRSE